MSFVNILLRNLLDNILIKLERCRRYVLLHVDRFLILVPEIANVTRLFLKDLFLFYFLIFVLSKVILLCVGILKPKHEAKNRRSGKLAFFSLNLLTKDYITSDVIGSFLMVSDWQRRWHPSNANYKKGLSLGQSNLINFKESGYDRAFLSRCKPNMAKKNRHIKSVCRVKVYILLTVTPICLCLPPMKIFFVVRI